MLSSVCYCFIGPGSVTFTGRLLRKCSWVHLIAHQGDWTRVSGRFRRGRHRIFTAKESLREKRLTHCSASVLEPTQALDSGSPLNRLHSVRRMPARLMGRDGALAQPHGQMTSDTASQLLTL